MPIEIIKRLREEGHEAYLVGGCVRDQLLGRPVEDYDIATGAHPNQVVELFPGSKTVGASFGVVIVPSESGNVEVATYRSEGDYVDGRRPGRVSFAHSAKEDVQRRDFTINGMLFDPIEERLVDYVGGRADLEKRLIRAIGSADTRFNEDKLRMLRAVRFAARLGFEIEAETLAAIQTHAPEILEIAPERIRDELNRILTGPGPRRGLELLDESGLLSWILPEISAMKGIEQPPQFHPEGDVWTHTLIMIEGLVDPSVTLAWGTLLHDVGKPDTFSETDRIRFNGHVDRGVEITEQICERLRFSNTDTTQIKALVANHMKFMDLPKMRPSKRKRFLWQPCFEEHLELHRRDCLSSHGSLTNYDYAIAELDELRREQPVPPAPLINGEDLKNAGYVPGPIFSRILAAVVEEQLDGRLSDKESALEFVRAEFS